MIGNSFPRSGVMAGGASVLAFTIIHHIFISNIWFSFPLMLVAGAMCGGCVGWSFGRLVKRPSLGHWLRYNLLYDTLFFLLGTASALMFEPVTPMAALVEANAPPDDLIRQALPLTAVFTLTAAVLVTLLYGRTLPKFGAALLTCTLLVLLLGLNVSTLGLVAIPRGSLYLVAEFFGLILLLNAVYTAVFIGLEWRKLQQIVEQDLSHGTMPL